MSDCACLWGSADSDDQPAFYTRKWRTARKFHECCECRRTIVKGTQYEYFSGRWDGDFNVYRTCVACQDIRSSLYCDAWMFNQLWEDVTEQIFRGTGLTIACVDKLATVEGKAYLQQRWMEYVEKP